jgi:hypothetical protein
MNVGRDNSFLPLRRDAFFARAGDPLFVKITSALPRSPFGSVNARLQSIIRVVRSRSSLTVLGSICMLNMLNG